MADTVSVVTGGTNSFQTTAEHLNAFGTDLLQDGVIGSTSNTSGVAPAAGALACNAQGSPNMTVAVTAGICYITATPTGQASQRLRASIAAQNATIASNSTGGTRFDWIYVKIDATNANTPSVAGDNVASIVVSRSTSATTDNGTPPTYGKNIAIVTVANSASSITNGNIADTRTIAGVAVASAADGWTLTGESWTYASAVTITVPSDATQKYAVGDRIKLTQTTVKYFVITGVASTTLTITGGTDYTLANAAITNNYYSKALSPVGYPQYFNYTPTWTNLTIGSSTQTFRFSVIGRTLDARIHFAASTSFAVSGFISFSVPVNMGTQMSGPDDLIGWGLATITGGYFLVARWKTSSSCELVSPLVSSTAVLENGTSAGAPNTWTTGSTFGLTLRYEI